MAVMRVTLPADRASELYRVQLFVPQSSAFTETKLIAAPNFDAVLHWLDALGLKVHSVTHEGAVYRAA